MVRVLSVLPVTFLFFLEISFLREVLSSTLMNLEGKKVVRLYRGTRPFSLPVKFFFFSLVRYGAPAVGSCRRETNMANLDRGVTCNRELLSLRQET